jgi:hypothetical protein
MKELQGAATISSRMRKSKLYGRRGLIFCTGLSYFAFVSCFVCGKQVGEVGMEG